MARELELAIEGLADIPAWSRIHGAADLTGLADVAKNQIWLRDDVSPDDIAMAIAHEVKHLTHPEVSDLPESAGTTRLLEEDAYRFAEDFVWRAHLRAAGYPV
jgi:hypothetical protein